MQNKLLVELLIFYLMIYALLVARNKEQLWNKVDPVGLLWCSNAFWKSTTVRKKRVKDNLCCGNVLVVFEDHAQDDVDCGNG